MVESSPLAKQKIAEALKKMESGISDKKPEKKTKPRDILYPSVNYERAMQLQKAGLGFGNYSGKKRTWDLAKGGKITKAKKANW